LSVVAARLILGAVFVFSGVAKVLDAQSFMAALPIYPIPEWLVPWGMLVPTIEVVLGAALCWGIALRPAAKIALGLLTAFSVVILSGMVSGGLGTCGCFGRLLESSPSVALARNAALMAMAVWIWRGSQEESPGWRSWQSGALAVLLLLSGTLTGYTTHTPLIDRSLARVGEGFPLDGFVGDAPVLQGKQLAFVFAVSCHPCWDGMANAKALAADPDFDLFGVTASTPYEVDWLATEFDVSFPVYMYDTVAFGEAFRLWPAIYYLEDGKIVGKVEGAVPTTKTLKDVYLTRWP
jgi:hypothetical protein